MALAHDNITPPSGGLPPARGLGSTEVERFYQKLADNLPGFERRKEQYDLTVAIAGTLLSGGNLCAQAPTGTGKSFAVGGGILAAFYGSKKTTVIATANNSLLEQYASKDLPFLQSMFPGLKWARAKGKNNYACIEKGEGIFSQQSLFSQSDAVKRLQEWYDTTASGDKEEIPFEVPDVEWQKINADDTCTGKKCLYFKECHYYRAKDEIKQADIVVTNFDLVLLDQFNPDIELFPAYDALILDEAHQLEDKAISKLEVGLTEKQIANYILKAQKSYNVADAALDPVRAAAANIFRAYRALLPQGQERQSIIPDANLLALTDDFQKAMNALADEVWKFKTPENTRERKAQDNLRKHMEGAGLAAQAVVSNNSRYVSWVEQTKTDIKVVTCPYRVAKILYDTLFSNPAMSVICLSATLAAKGKKPQLTASAAGLQPVAMFDQFRQRVGMILTGEFDCPSPFNYPKNCVLYLPKPPEGVTKPDVPGYTAWMNDEILRLVELSQGRALILTTSTKALKEISGFLTRSTTLPVKAQSPEVPNSKLIEWFRSTAGSILVGTASFWEGISIEGDDLKLVIIDKLPFPNSKDPIQQARDAWYRKDPTKKNKAFMDLGLFPAIIRLNQGFGRLIRTKSDTGVVAILDPRLTHAGYRNTILNSLPKAYKTTLLQDARLVQALKGDSQ